MEDGSSTGGSSNSVARGEDKQVKSKGFSWDPTYLDCCPLEMLPTLGEGLPPQFIIPRAIFTEACLVDAAPVKLTTKINHHGLVQGGLDGGFLLK